MNNDSLENNSSEENSRISTQKNTLDGNLTTITKKNTSDERDTQKIQTSITNVGQDNLPNAGKIPISNINDPISSSTGFRNESSEGLTDELETNIPLPGQTSSHDGVIENPIKSSEKPAMNSTVEKKTSKNNTHPIQNETNNVLNSPKSLSSSKNDLPSIQDAQQNY